MTESVLTTALRIVGGSRTFVRGDEQVHALRDINLELRGGEFVALRGPSGSGKSTLLLVLAGWERLDTGSAAVVDSRGTHAPSELDWSRMGIVPQSLGLMTDLTAQENVMLPARLAKLSTSPDAGDGYPRAVMKSLDIEKLKSSMSAELSLGEQQRVAVARAIALRQPIVLADEPSTHQDADHGAAVFAALRSAAELGAIVVVATHDPAGLDYADRVLTMSDGELHIG
jgi:putative ABC transport system ATP-binding protein